MIIINIDFHQLLNSLIGPILGSIGTFFAFLLKEQYKNYLERRNLAAAFSAEIEGLEQQYIKVTYPSLKKQCEQNGGVFAIIIKEDFFTVFNNNTNKISIFEPNDTALLVKKYVAAKGFIDTLRGVTASVEKLDKVYITKTLSDEQIMGMFNMIKEQCKSIIDDHDNIVSAITETKIMLSKYIHASFYSYIISKLKPRCKYFNNKQ